MNPEPPPGEPEARDRSPAWRILLGLLVMSLLVRGGVLVVMPGALADDPDDYRGLAKNLVQHGRFETRKTPPAYRPPLYPLMLTGCVALGEFSRVAVGILHLAMGLATVWLAFILGRRWGMGQYPAALAAALVACDPILLAQSTHVMTETAATLLAVVALIGLTSAGERPSTGRAAIAGASVALAALCRPGLWAWAAAAGIALPAFARSWPRRLKVLLGFTAAAGIVLGPWVIRNQIRLGRPILTTTHGGYTLLLGNNPQFYDYLRSAPWGSVWDGEEFSRAWRRRALADELEANRAAYAQAWETIARQPRMFFYSCLVRAARLWQLVPHQVVADEAPLRRLARWGVGGWYLVELSLAAAGLWAVLGRRWRPAWVWGLLLAGSLTAVHTFYWSQMRMRAPLMPVVALAAAAGLARDRTGPGAAGARPERPGRATTNG